MDDLTRREALKSIAMATTVPDLWADQEKKPMGKMTAEDMKIDRQRVIACGMTEAEADCWAAVADAAGKFFDLPKLHPTDADEVAEAIHIIQYKLLSRPTYRKYLELARGPKQQ
jgi:hypothetical protein